MGKNMVFPRRMMCWLMVLCLMLSLAACYPANRPTTGPTDPTGPSVTPTQPTVNPTDPTGPTDPTDPTDPVGAETDLEFTLTQADVDNFYLLLAECEALSLVGEDMDAVDAVSAELDEVYEFLDAQSTIALILYYCNKDDKTLSQQYLDSSEIFIQANDAYIQMARRLYLSDSPIKDVLFEDWTEQDIAMLLAYDEEIAQLRQRNEEINIEYYESNNEDKQIQMYIEFVQNNNKIAQFYGYDNYYEYAYELVYDRDYSPEELEQMRNYVKDYVVPVFHQTYLNYYHSAAYLSQPDWDGLNNFLEAAYDSTDTNYVNRYLSELPESMVSAFSQMLDNDSLFATGTAAESGAFTTMIGDRSYCYFGPSYSDCSTVVHEAGHYYASLYTDLGMIPMDLAEVHSQGNEWLFVAAMDHHMTNAQHDALVNYRIYNDLATIMICLMVDEFESLVYSTDISQFTAEDFDALMESVATQYFAMSYVEYYIADINWYWRMVVVDQPVYYISYAVSAIAALDLYTVAVENYDAAVAAYQLLCENMDEELGFQGNLNAAGLAGPFQEAFYQRLTTLIESRS